MNAALEPWYQKYGRKKGKNYMNNIAIATLLTEIDLHIAMVDDLFDILGSTPRATMLVSPPQRD